MLAGKKGLETGKKAGLYSQHKHLDSQACGGSDVDGSKVLILMLVVILPLPREGKDEKAGLVLCHDRHVE
jgi:hypothetical protein